MKILHAWDQAGIGSRIANYINVNGLGRSYVVKNAQYDNMNIESEYKFNVMVNGRKRFIFSCMKEMLRFRPDIVHVHSWERGVIIARILVPRAKIVLHYHGTDIRNRSIPLLMKILTSKILVSTRDLMRPGVEYRGYPR